MYSSENDDAYQLHINSGDSLSVRENLLVRLPIEELDALVPLVHIVGILPQHHTAQQNGPPLHQMLQPRQSESNSTAQSVACCKLSSLLARL